MADSLYCCSVVRTTTRDVQNGQTHDRTISRGNDVNVLRFYRLFVVVTAVSPRDHVATNETVAV